MADNGGSAEEKYGVSHTNAEMFTILLPRAWKTPDRLSGPRALVPPGFSSRLYRQVITSSLSYSTALSDQVNRLRRRAL
jgi:hypothetical protein